LDGQHGSLLGPRFDDGEIRATLDAAGAAYQRIDDDAWADHVADLLAEGRVVGLLQGRMEFGPRALGSRSILGDPRSGAMQSRMNRKIKFRESFRPFAPIVLREHAAEWFGLEPDQESPYMLLVAPVHETKRRTADGPHQPPAGDAIDGDRAIMARLNQLRSEIPAVTHVDDSARVQTVDAERFPRLHALLSRFHAKTGCPVLINTSFNVRGEPIVATPDDAYRCFMATHMDALVLENYVLTKPGDAAPDTAAAEAHRAQFALD